MKKKYTKPEFEFINFETSRAVMTDPLGSDADDLEGNLPWGLSEDDIPAPQGLYD